MPLDHVDARPAANVIAFPRAHRAQDVPRAHRQARAAVATSDRLRADAPCTVYERTWAERLGDAAALAVIAASAAWSAALLLTALGARLL